MPSKIATIAAAMLLVGCVSLTTAAEDWRYGEPPADCYQAGLAFIETHDVRFYERSVAYLNTPGLDTPAICGNWNDGVAEGCLLRTSSAAGGFWQIWVGYDARDPGMVRRHEIAHLVCDHG